MKFGGFAAATKRRVLLIDSDPQGNATMGCGVDKSQLLSGTCEVLLGDVDVRAAMVPIEPAGFALLPTNPGPEPSRRCGC